MKQGFASFQWFNAMLLMLVAGLAGGWGAAEAKGEEPLRMAVTDIEGLEQIQREFGAFKDLLEKHSGCQVKFYPVPNRTAAVEAVKIKRRQGDLVAQMIEEQRRLGAIK